MTCLFSVLSGFSIADAMAFMATLLAGFLAIFALVWMIVGFVYGIGIFCLAFFGAYGDDHDYEERIAIREHRAR